MKDLDKDDQNQTKDKNHYTGWRAQRWPTPAVANCHSGPRAKGCSGSGSFRARSPGGTAVSKATPVPAGCQSDSANSASTQYRVSGGDTIRCTDSLGCQCGSTGRERCS